MFYSSLAVSRLVKLLFCLLALCLAVCLLPLQAFAVDVELQSFGYGSQSKGTFFIYKVITPYGDGSDLTVTAEITHTPDNTKFIDSISAFKAVKGFNDITGVNGVTWTIARGELGFRIVSFFIPGKVKNVGKILIALHSENGTIYRLIDGPIIPGDYSVSGQVFLEGTNEVLSGILVGSANNRTTISDSDGSFTLEDLPKSNTELIVSHPELKIVSSEDFSSGAGATQNRKIVLGCKKVDHTFDGEKCVPKKDSGEEDGGSNGSGTNPTIEDCDQDGVSDSQEIIDGTGVCDSGSFHTTLKSPAFVKWNTYLSQLNYLELLSTGSSNILAKVIVFDISGKQIKSIDVEIPAGNQIDIDINEMVGKANTYGLAKVEFDDKNPEIKLIGRMTNYRPDPIGETYSFAFAKELINPVKGTSYATSNTYDPQGMGYQVPNWVEIQNLDEENQRGFTYNLYSQTGELIETHDVILSPLAERDINGGHENGEGVYLVEVIPHDSDSPYLMTVSRYSSNHNSGAEADTYNFAFARQGQKGTGDLQYARITNQIGGCYRQSNWVELANVLDEPVVVNLVFRDKNGEIVGDVNMELPSRSQYHFNGSGLLKADSSGSVEVTSTTRDALILQSLVYYHDCKTNLTQTAYASPGRIPGRLFQTGSYNRFLGMRNMLNVINASEGVAETELRLTSIARNSNAHNMTLDKDNQLEIDINDSDRFSTVSDSYGSISLTSSKGTSLVAEVLRIRMSPFDNGTVDFVMQTPLY